MTCEFQVVAVMFGKLRHAVLKWRAEAYFFVLLTGQNRGSNCAHVPGWSWYFFVAVDIHKDKGKGSRNTRN